jgi:hypothetical protein
MAKLKHSKAPLSTLKISFSTLFSTLEYIVINTNGLLESPRDYEPTRYPIGPLLRGGRGPRETSPLNSR